MSRSITIRIPEDLYDDLKSLADFEGRSLNNLVSRLLRQALPLVTAEQTLRTKRVSKRQS